MKKTYYKQLSAILFLFICSLVSLNADIKLPKLVGDHMVLQQGEIARIWGFADVDEKLSIQGSWMKEAIAIVGNKKGQWKCELPLPPAGGPYKINFKGKNTIELNNVLVGEVWVCSGQSNMEWGINLSSNPQVEVPAANHPNIRLFMVLNDIALHPQKTLNRDSQWKVCTPQSIAEGGVKGFSSVAYFFGRKLHRELGVPIGLIDSTWGGTAAEAWTSEEKLKQIGGYENNIASLKKFRDNSQQGKQQKLHPHIASSLYNAMIAPLTHFNIKGVIWYQGESNARRALNYTRLKRGMINSWRESWDLGPFPFYYTQIAPFLYGNHNHCPELQDSQTRLLDHPNVGMAITTDIGNILDIHPKNKKDVGLRLARWALSKTYQKPGIEVSGPIFKKISIEGHKIRVHFDYAKGLHARDKKPLRDFEIAGKNGIFVYANATIENDTVVISSPVVPKPVHVQLAWYNTSNHNLSNGAGLPASCFTSVPLSERKLIRNSPTMAINKKKWWMKRFEKKISQAKKGNIDLMLIGDSITHGWEGAGKKVWDKYYAKRKGFNIGYSGDRTENVIWRLMNGEIDNISPKAAVIMIGTNNTDGKHYPVAHSAEQVTRGITKITRILQTKLPETKILLLGIFPFGEKMNPRRERINQINRQISKLADGEKITYLNINKAFMNEDGTLPKSIMPDFLHLNEKGYQIWAEQMEPTLAKLLGERAITSKK